MLWFILICISAHTNTHSYSHHGSSPWCIFLYIYTELNNPFFKRDFPDCLIDFQHLYNLFVTGEVKQSVKQHLKQSCISVMAISAHALTHSHTHIHAFFAHLLLCTSSTAATLKSYVSITGTSPRNKEPLEELSDFSLPGLRSKQSSSGIISETQIGACSRGVTLQKCRKFWEWGLYRWSFVSWVCSYKPVCFLIIKPKNLNTELQWKTFDGLADNRLTTGFFMTLKESLFKTQKTVVLREFYCTHNCEKIK